MSQSNPTKLAKHQVIAVPASLEAKLSSTSFAEECFPLRKFCRNLQEYLVSYSLTVTSPFTLTDESYTFLEKQQEKYQ